MHKWLLFEMAKSPKPDERKAIPAEKGTGVGALSWRRVRADPSGGAAPKAAAPPRPLPARGLWLLVTSSSRGQPPFGGPWGEQG